MRSKVLLAQDLTPLATTGPGFAGGFRKYRSGWRRVVVEVVVVVVDDVVVVAVVVVVVVVVTW